MVKLEAYPTQYYIVTMHVFEKLSCVSCRLLVSPKVNYGFRVGICGLMIQNQHLMTY